MPEDDLSAHININAEPAIEAIDNLSPSMGTPPSEPSQGNPSDGEDALRDAQQRIAESSSQYTQAQQAGFDYSTPTVGSTSPPPPPPPQPSLTSPNIEGQRLYDRLRSAGTPEFEARQYAGIRTPYEEFSSFGYNRGTQEEYLRAQTRGFGGSAEEFYVGGEFYRQQRYAEAFEQPFDEVGASEGILNRYSAWQSAGMPGGFAGYGLAEAPIAAMASPASQFFQGIGGMTVAYAGMRSLSAAVGAYSPALAGQGYLPEQTGETAGASAIPFITTALGGAAGFALTRSPAGAGVGAMFGGALGAPIENALDSYLGGTAQGVRNVIPLATGGGQGLDAIEDFVGAVRRAGLAVDDFTSSFGKQGIEGPTNASGYALQWNNLNDRYGSVATPQMLDTASTFLARSPQTYSYETGLGGGTLTGSQAQTSAELALIQGDYSSYLSLQGIAAAANPAYGGASWVRYNDQFRGNLMGSQANLEYLQPVSSEQIGAISAGMAGGASAAEITSLSTPLIGTDRSAISETDRLIANYRAMASNFVGDPQAQRAFNTLIAQAQASEVPYRVEMASARRGAYEMTVQEFGAVDTSNITQLNTGITQGTLAGYTPQSMMPMVSERAFVEQGYADRLRQQANNATGILPPSEIYQLRSQASELDAQRMQEVYENRMQGYELNLARQDVSISGGRIGVQAATAYGQAGDIQGAYASYASDTAGKLKELWDQIQAGGLTAADAADKQRQYNDLMASYVVIQAQSFEANYGRQQAVLGSFASSSSIEAGITTTQQGSVAGMGQLAQSGQYYRAMAAQAEQALPSAPAADQPAIRQQIAQYRQSAQQADLGMGMVTLPPELQSGIATAQGELARMQMGYMQPGSYYNAQMGLFNQYGEGISYVRQQMAEVPKSITDPQDQAAAMATLNQQLQQLMTAQAQSAYESDRNYFSRLPAMAVGGTSFMARYLPSPAQAAWATEQMGYGDIALRNFGSYDRNVYDAYAIQGGYDEITAAGQNPASYFPGNLSMSAIAQTGHGAPSRALGSTIGAPDISSVLTPGLTPSSPSALGAPGGSSASAATAGAIQSYDEYHGITRRGNSYSSYTLDIPWGLDYKDLLQRYGNSPNGPSNSELWDVYAGYSRDSRAHSVAVAQANAHAQSGGQTGSTSTPTAGTFRLDGGMLTVVIKTQNGQVLGTGIGTLANAQMRSSGVGQGQVPGVVPTQQAIPPAGS